MKLNQKCIKRYDGVLLSYDHNSIQKGIRCNYADTYLIDILKKSNLFIKKNTKI